MKVIGRKGDGFIVEASREDLEQLVGHYYKGHTNFKEGDEIAIDKMFLQLYRLSRNEKQLKEAAEQLRNYAKLLELTDPIIQEYIKPEESKE